MKKEITVIPISDDVVTYLEQLDWEMSGSRVLYLNALDMELSQEKLDMLEQKFQEAYDRYELAKMEFWKDYSDQFPNCKWELEFSTNMLRVLEGVE